MSGRLMRSAFACKREIVQWFALARDSTGTLATPFRACEHGTLLYGYFGEVDVGLAFVGGVVADPEDVALLDHAGVAGVAAGGEGEPFG